MLNQLQYNVDQEETKEGRNSIQLTRRFVSVVAKMVLLREDRNLVASGRRKDDGLYWGLSCMEYLFFELLASTSIKLSMDTGSHLTPPYVQYTHRGYCLKVEFLTGLRLFS